MSETTAATQPALFPPGTRVNFFSPAGPCLSAVVVRVNRTKVALNFYGTRKDEYRFMVHLPGSCSSCMGHPQTLYPHGYMD